MKECFMIIYNCINIQRAVNDMFLDRVDIPEFDNEIDEIFFELLDSINNNTEL